MLATLVIGLREGLEAALIVGIIAAFLRNNSKSLTPMWIGVVLAVLLSIAVGVGLKLVEEALPQAAQEGLETVIGIIAVCFVTGMIVWMNKHARDMKRQLETEAAHALGRASTYALASMAFLAVLKEGFETSVFLLATFSAAQSASLAAAGAVIGILIAIVIGWGIYAGGVRFNLSKFFRYTAVFLILVAAGLVISSLRTAHEAGWVNAGQLTVVNLGWLVAPGTVQSALITGVLGIPADPRLIEVFGWCAYIIPVALYLYWPKAHRPGARASIRIKQILGATAVIAALGLALGYPVPHADMPSASPYITTTNDDSTIVGQVNLKPAEKGSAFVVTVNGRPPVVIPQHENDARQHQHKGVMAQTWKASRSTTLAEAPATLSLQQVVALSGGRIPVGLDPRAHPGPFNAAWTVHRATRVWTAHDKLLDAKSHRIVTVALTGSGLNTPRTMTVQSSDLINVPPDWHIRPTYVHAAAVALNKAEAAQRERQLWAVALPVGLAIVVLILFILAWRDQSRLPISSHDESATDSTHSRVDNAKPKGASSHVA